jgi:predicted nucleotidyltransferase
MDFVRARLTLESLIAPVVDVLAAAGADPERLMLLGAVCRDVLHQAGGHDEQLRRTGDLDLAVAVDGQDAYTALTAHLTQIPGSTSIRFSVAGQTLDLVPFGEIEYPDGHVPTPPHPTWP